MALCNLLPGCVLPDYAGRSTANLAPTILDNFGVKPKAPVIPELKQALQGMEKVVLFLVDAMGYGQLQRENCPVMHSLEQRTITACAPSTTVTTLVSLATGLLPSQHGIVGYSMYLKGIGVVNMLKQRLWDGGPIGLPAPVWTDETIAAQLSRRGVRTAAVVPGYVARSGLSQWTLKGADIYPYDSLDDCFRQVRAALAKSQYVFAYAEVYDTLCHQFGPNSDAARLYLKGVDEALCRFVQQGHKDTLLAVTADHGQLQVQRNRGLLYERHPFLLSMVEAISGEARMSYIHCKYGLEKRVAEYLDTLSPVAHVLPAHEAAGLFGVNAKPNIGDFVVIPKEDYTLWVSPSHHIGKHGGLSEAEMRVPLLVQRL